MAGGAPGTAGSAMPAAMAATVSAPVATALLEVGDDALLDRGHVSRRCLRGRWGGVFSVDRSKDTHRDDHQHAAARSHFLQHGIESS